MFFEMALLEAYKKGFAKGYIEGLEFVARNLIRGGYTLEEVHEFTNLSMTRIKELADEIKKSDT